MSKDKSQIEIKENKNLSQAFKFLTENYKTNNKFKTQIIGKGKNEENICQNIAGNEELKNNENIENMVNNNNEKIFSPNFKPANVAEISNSNNFKNTKKYRWSFSKDIRRKINNSLINPMNNYLFPQNLFYAYLSMNNPNAIKIPVPVPVPVPVAVAGVMADTSTWPAAGVPS